MYAITDANFNITGLVGGTSAAAGGVCVVDATAGSASIAAYVAAAGSATAGQVVERFVYDPYGRVFLRSTTSRCRKALFHNNDATWSAKTNAAGGVVVYFCFSLL